MYSHIWKHDRSSKSGASSQISYLFDIDPTRPIYHVGSKQLTAEIVMYIPLNTAFMVKSRYTYAMKSALFDHTKLIP